MGVSKSRKIARLCREPRSRSRLITAVGMMSLLFFVFIALDEYTWIYGSNCNYVTLSNQTFVSRIEHCHSKSGLNGRFVIHANLDSSAVFKMRLSGPEILTVNVSSFGSHLFVGKHSLTLGGVYNMELILLYEDFDSENVAANNMTTLLPRVVDEYAWRVAGAQHINQHKPPCSRNSNIYDGRWIIHNTTSLDYFKYTRIQDENPIKGWPSDHPDLTAFPSPDVSLPFEWSANECSIKNYQRDIAAIEQCIKERTICFVGDSQLRSLHDYTVMFLIGGRPMSKEPLAHDNFRHFTKTFGNYTCDDIRRWNGCTDVFFNYGQWPASFVAEEGAWPASFYKQEVEKDMLFLDMYRLQSSTSVYWIETNAAGFPRRLFAPTEQFKQDWRTPPVLDIYNRDSTAAAMNRNISVLGMYGVTKPVSDLSFDMAHLRGVVGWVLSNLFYNSLCNT